MIDRFSDIPQFDKNKLFRIVLFSYISLNSDMHLKNFSLIEDKKIELSPGYDLLPVKMFVKDNDDLALTLNGKKRNIMKNDFLKFGVTLNVPKKAIDLMLGELISKKRDFIDIINNSILSEQFKQNYIKKIEERIALFE